MRADRPNVLLLMADQLAASALATYGHPVARTPHLDALAATAAVCERAYCNSPICAASRASMMTGRLPSEIGVYDNGAELPAAVPTFCHALRQGGYRTILSGKMHFVGPDQLHGFDERRTPDIYPAGFDWTPDWGQGLVHNPGASVRRLAESGPCAWSLQMDYDEDVAHEAVRVLYEQARHPDQPFLLCASFTHPHDPFEITPEYWDLYRDTEIPPPRTPALALAAMPPYARWVQVHHELDLFPPSPDTALRARRAYLAMVSYLDVKIGQVLAALGGAGLADDTVVIFTSDHGEMLGEHGMWYKRVFYEDAARVPFIVRWPGQVRPRRIAPLVSLLDLAPTLCDLAGIQASVPPALTRGFGGRSLVPLLRGDAVDRPEPVLAEYLGEGVIQPCRMVRCGRYKYVFVRGEAPQLFDLAADPDETVDLADRADLAPVRAAMHAQAIAGFDPDALYGAVVASQQTRRALAGVPGRPNWDFVPPPPDPGQYVRGETVPEAARRQRVDPRS